MPPVQKNVFLLSSAGHGHVFGTCFCRDCRGMKLEELHDYSNNEPHQHFMVRLPLDEDSRLVELRAVVRKQIIMGEYYKRSSLA